jgi:hypothetical protein
MDIPDNDVAFVNMSIRESKWRQITKITIPIAQIYKLFLGISMHFFVLCPL